MVITGKYGNHKDSVLGHDAVGGGKEKKKKLRTLIERGREHFFDFLNSIKDNNGRIICISMIFLLFFAYSSAQLLLQH